MTKLQVFFFHFAGGCHYSYNFLKDHLPAQHHYHFLELPGRGRRFDEELITDKNKAVLDLLKQLHAIRNRDIPYVIFGHSMGALMGLWLTFKMKEMGDPPGYLIVSGTAGPGIEEERVEKIHLMDSANFKAKLESMGGVPEEILEDEELFSFFDPIMRADFEVVDPDNFTEKGIKVECPIYALMGDEEEHHNKIKNWQRYTKQQFHEKLLSGNHFFIYEHPEQVGEVLMKCCNKVTEE